MKVLFYFFSLLWPQNIKLFSMWSGILHVILQSVNGQNNFYKTNLFEVAKRILIFQIAHAALWENLCYFGEVWLFSFPRKSGKLAENVGTLMSTHLVIIGLNNAIEQKILMACHQLYHLAQISKGFCCQLIWCHSWNHILKKWSYAI